MLLNIFLIWVVLGILGGYRALYDTLLLEGATKATSLATKPTHFHGKCVYLIGSAVLGAVWFLPGTLKEQDRLRMSVISEMNSEEPKNIGVSSNEQTKH